MTLKEITKALNDFATQDIDLCRESKHIAITQTSKGTLWMDYKKGIFFINDSYGNTLFHGEDPREFLINVYDIKLAEE